MKMYTLVCIIVCLTIESTVDAVIHYKVRGPPSAPRPPRPPYSSKGKMPMPMSMHSSNSRSPSRPYPRPIIPLQMPSYKVPVIARPPKTPQPLIFPSAAWKTPTAAYKPPVEKPYLTSPPVTPSYDFPMNTQPVLSVPTIKQVGEKGPIHTIPAPNLSPADKPGVILEEPAQKHTYQYTKEHEISPNAISPNAYASTLVSQALPLVSPKQHQYQVTENDPHDQLVHNTFNVQKAYYAPDPDQNIAQKLPQFIDANSFSNNVKLPQFVDANSFSNNVKVFPSDLYANQHLGINSAPHFSAQELYQLLNGIPQQPVVDSYGMQLMQQSQQQQQQYVQQAHHYQTLLNAPQLFQPEPPFINQIISQIPDKVSQSVKDNFKPQFHTFNYEEKNLHKPANNNNNELAQSRVTADYSLEPETAESNNKMAVQNQNEALAQAQYIQQYFGNQDNSEVSDNNEVESNQSNDVHESSNKASQILSQLSSKSEMSPSMFYASLPNRQAAEALATLQAAGSVNSNLMKIAQQHTEQNTNNRDKMRIYVPDEEESYEDMDTQTSEKTEPKSNEGSSQGIRVYETTYSQSKHNAESNNNDKSVEYEDYSNDEEALVSSETDTNNNSKNQVLFGNRLKTKTANTR